MILSFPSFTANYILELKKGVQHSCTGYIQSSRKWWLHDPIASEMTDDYAHQEAQAQEIAHYT